MRAVLAKLSSFLVAVPLLAVAAPAQQATDAPRRAFDIPAQPLDTALAAWFRVTGVQLLYDSAVTAGRRSAAVHGAFTPREALERLVAPAGVAVRYTGREAAVLTLAPPSTTAVPLGRVMVREAAPPRAPSPLDRLVYYRRLEEELTARLAADPRTGDMAFAALVEIRINVEGRISEVRVTRGTGSARNDRTLAQVLSEAAVQTPPDNVAQPLLVTLRGRRVD